jgi:ATP-binding cassette, subfamily C, bacterial PrsD
MNSRIFRAMALAPLRVRTRGDGLQALRDFDQIRSFLSGAGPGAMFDLPWMPLYVAICFLFHPMIGWTAVFGVVVLILLTVATNHLSDKPTRATSEASSARDGLAQSFVIPRSSTPWAWRRRLPRSGKNETPITGRSIAAPPT